VPRSVRHAPLLSARARCSSAPCARGVAATHASKTHPNARQPRRASSSARREPPAQAASWSRTRDTARWRRAAGAQGRLRANARRMPKRGQRQLRRSGQLRPAAARRQYIYGQRTRVRLFSARSGPIRRLRRSPPAPRTSRPCGSAAARLFSPKRVRAVVESIGLRAARRRGGAGHAAVLERRAGYTRAVLTRDLYRTRLHIARLTLFRTDPYFGQTLTSDTQLSAAVPPRPLRVCARRRGCSCAVLLSAQRGQTSEQKGADAALCRAFKHLFKTCTGRR
jgi:hypothetical protein